MAISNKDLDENMSDGTKDSYIRLRQALDSLTYVALAEFDFSNVKADKSDVRADKREISEIVSNGVKAILQEISKKRSQLWNDVAVERAEAFVRHSFKLLGNEEFVKQTDRLLNPELQTDEDRAKEETGVREKDAAFVRGDHVACPPGFMLVDGYCVPI